LTNDAVHITPSRAQADLIQSILPKVAIVGGKGSGKTFAGVAFMCNMIASFPGSRGLLVWNTSQQARDIYSQDIEPRLKELCWTYSFNQTSMILTVFSCTIHIRSAEVDVMKRVESVSYHWGWGDEVSYWNLESFNTFQSRVRLTRLGSEPFQPTQRITSMPDEPDSWLYQKLEQNEYRLHEIGLSANPDRAFVANYTKQLQSIYKGEQLKRYLDGERVSIAGIGLFATKAEQQGDYPYDANIDLELCWDFNSEYRAVTAWQSFGKDEQSRDIIGCVASFQMQGNTLADDAEALCKVYAGHKAHIYLNGDASGENRQIGVTGSMWKSIREVFQMHFPKQSRDVVPKVNPSVKNTIECVNWALAAGLVRFDKTSAKKAFLSMSACKADKYGEIDKSVDYTPSGVRTHEADTCRYAIWRKYQYLYPGSRNRYALYV
jgi:hypothetical protein